MVLFLNGRFVSEGAARVSPFDRGFLYGDGLFETLRISRGQVLQWDAHMERLTRGAHFLKLRPPLTSPEMLHVAGRLVTLNDLPDAVLRLTLTRGPGPRGYSPKGADSPTLVMALHPLPAAKSRGLRLITSTFRIAAADPLAQLKTCSKLLHVLARAEADAQRAGDALLLNARGQIAETTSSNIFWFSGNTLFTPSSRSGALAGITRATVLQLASRLELPWSEVAGVPADLRNATGVFLTNSVYGIVKAVELDGKRLRSSPLLARLAQAYRRYLATEAPSVRKTV